MLSIGLEPPVIMFLQNSMLVCHTFCVYVGEAFRGGLSSSESISDDWERLREGGLDRPHYDALTASGISFLTGSLPNPIPSTLIMSPV
jgi:hypothetical protein